MSNGNPSRTAGQTSSSIMYMTLQAEMVRKSCMCPDYMCPDPSVLILCPDHMCPDISVS